MCVDVVVILHCDNDLVGVLRVVRLSLMQTTCSLIYILLHVCVSDDVCSSFTVFLLLVSTCRHCRRLKKLAICCS